MIGKRNVKKASSRLRQKSSCSTRSWWRRSRIRLLPLLGEGQVNVLQRGPAHLELRQGHPGAEGLAGQLVQDARGVLGLDDDDLAVAPVADLGRGGGADQVGRRARRDDLALREH